MMHLIAKDPDSPTSQLAASIHETLTRTLSTRRPILHHLNADSSWLLQIPRPPCATQRGGRIYYNILIDPWLTGPQSDVAKWFSQQWHSFDSAVSSIKDVEDLAWNIEGAAGNNAEREEGGIDVVAICHEFTDHCHRETLEQVGRDIPVFATKVYISDLNIIFEEQVLISCVFQKAANLIRSWNHFRTVIDVPPFSGTHTDWKTTSMPPLPEYISITRISSETDAFYYHSALLFAFNTHPPPSSPPKTKRKSKGHYSRNASIEPDAPAECVIYTPHGVHPTSLEPIQQASPPLKTLCFIHGLHDVSISWGQQLNLGVYNGLQVQRILKSKYWVSTHDEVKKGGGLVGWFLRRKVLSLEEALKEEETRLDNVKEGHEKGTIGDVRFEDVGNGESRVLD
jgi:hypothetical protein